MQDPGDFVGSYAGYWPFCRILCRILVIFWDLTQDRDHFVGY